MLRKSIPIFKIALVILVIGAVIYYFSEFYGKLIAGTGLMVLAISFILYILHMFNKYGEHKKTY